MKSRIFNVMQYEYNPVTKESLNFTEENIKACIAHKSIKRWAYVRHDKDVFSEKDEMDNADYRQGELKPPHWHIVLEFGTRQVEIAVVAKWLGVPENFVEIAKGHGAFLDCVQYLTHERTEQQELGKRLYADEEIRANFDFREELDKRAERLIRYGKDLNVKDMLRNEVLYNGLTLEKVKEKYPIEYQNDFRYLEACRIRYVNDVMPMPKMRMNFYVEGKGGIGKGLISKAIARALIDESGDMADDEIFFYVGSQNTSFERYNGQPVIIWDDCRASTLLEKLGSRENVFNIFDPFPPKMAQNIKYSSVILKNSINIVNSVDPWNKFLDDLAGEYTTKKGVVKGKEDKMQSYRRFPFFIVVHEHDYDLGMNKGLFEGTREYDQYLMYKGIQANFKRIKEQCGDNLELVQIVNGKAVKVVKDKALEMKEKMSHKQQLTDEEILEQFKNVGTVKSIATVKAEERE